MFKSKRLAVYRRLLYPAPRCGHKWLLFQLRCTNNNYKCTVVLDGAEDGFFHFSHDSCALLWLPYEYAHQFQHDGKILAALVHDIKSISSIYRRALPPLSTYLSVLCHISGRCFRPGPSRWTGKTCSNAHCAVMLHLSLLVMQHQKASRSGTIAISLSCRSAIHEKVCNNFVAAGQLASAVITLLVQPHTFWIHRLYSYGILASHPTPKVMHIVTFTPIHSLNSTTPNQQAAC